MTTLAALVAATPAATRGVPTGFVYGTGTWRHVIELADPAAGASVAWHDVTEWCAGYDLTRGADGYQGRYRASVATIDLWTDSDELAPWNPDTAPLFGVHVDLGPGLLIRSGFIRVDGGIVTAWNPRFTNKVEVWGDASYSHGKTRQHRIVARDTLTSAVGIPLPAFTEENWSDRMFNWLTNSGWPYGSAIYGAQFTDPGGVPIALVPDRPASSSAISELDATLDPSGLVWYTNRLGQLVVRPRVEDTFHAAAFAAGATGNEWPGNPVRGFSWAACAGDDGSGYSSYAIDHSPSAPFGFDETEMAVINHVVITAPSSTFDDDDPISIQRYDRHTMQASWISENDTVAAGILAFRANATVEARPLHTTVDLPGFFPGPADVEYLDPVTIMHRNTDAGLQVVGDGFLRSYREQVTPHGCDTAWAMTYTIDIQTVNSDGGLLPVEDLTIVDVGETTAEFSWTNPTQTVIPTHTQIRMLNPSSLWLTTDYPITGAEWAGLAPSTGYEFQVRLIRVVDGLITHYSPTRSVSFVTDEATVPHVDPGDGDVDLPDPPPGCFVGWELSWSDDGDAPWTVIDSGTVEEPPFDFHIDTTLLNDDYWYRVCSNQICGGVPGPVTCSALFPIGCLPTGRLIVDPYDDVDLIAYWPEICADHISEAKSDQPMTPGPALKGTGFDAAGIPTMLSGPAGTIGYGVQPKAPDGFDITLAVRVKISTLPVGGRRLLVYGGAWIEIHPSGAGFKVFGYINEKVGGPAFVAGSTVLTLGTVYDLAMVHDVTGVGTGTIKVYVNGTLDGTATAAGERRSSGLYEIGCAANSWITDCAVWDRVLAAADLPGAPTGVAVTINQGASQTDPTATVPIVFDVVFSEAVTGFATGDVTLTGTAGSTISSSTAIVTGSGATYTVAVTGSGLTTSGTVIASYAAGVCTSVAAGLADLASTSTDNSVQYNYPGPCNAVLNEPFDHLQKWSGSGSPTIVAGRNGGAVSLTGSGHTVKYTIPSALTSDYLTLGFAYKATSFANAQYLVQFRNDGTPVHEGSLLVTTAGALLVSKGAGTSATLATSAAGVITINTWYYIEIQWRLHDTLGSVNVRVNGTSVASASNVDTRVSASVYRDIQLWSEASTTAMFDDLYLTTGPGCSFQGDHAVGPTVDILGEPFNNAQAWNGSMSSETGGRTGNMGQLWFGLDAFYPIPAVARSATAMIGYAYKTTELGSARPLMQFQSDSGATTHVTIMLTTAGALQARRGDASGTVLGTSATGLIPINTWKYVEAQVVMSDTVGEITLRVNGTSVLTLTGVDTKNAGTATVFDRIKLSSSAAGTTNFDDLYVSMTSAAVFKGDHTES